MNRQHVHLSKFLEREWRQSTVDDMTNSTLKALGWSLTSLAIILTFGRFWIRWKRVKQVGWDDILNGCALVALIVYMALFAVYFPISLAAELYKLGISQTPPTDSELVYALELQLANAMFFWISKYAVKASFLATYYYVFRISGNFRKAWWFVVIYTALTFLAIFFGALWGCGSPSNYAYVLSFLIVSRSLTDS